MNTLTIQLYPSLLRPAAFLLAGHASSAIQPADLLHMAMEKLYRRPAAEIRNEAAAFSGLVRTIMQRTLVDEVRKSGARRRPDLLRANPLEAAADIQEESENPVCSDVREALTILGRRDPAAANLLWAHYLECRTFKEHCTRLGRSAPAISRRLTAALAALRSIVELEFGRQFQRGSSNHNATSEVPRHA
jgi:RNA polymerase sigma factor (sigma-70 family)